MTALAIIGAIALAVIVWRAGCAIRNAIIDPPHDKIGE